MDELGVGVVGYGFMGRAHAQAWRTAPYAFDLGVRPRLVAIAGRDEQAVARQARRLGFAGWSSDWRSLLTRDDVDLVDICAPGALHAPIATAALQAGKHVLCEKPLGRTVSESEAMVAAADTAARGGCSSMVGFNYRRVPAIEQARRLVGLGRLGDIRHVRATYLQDWCLDPNFPLQWRFVAEQAGTGALGDLGSHVVDLAQHLLDDDVAEVTAMLSTFVTERPVPRTGDGRAPVTVDDAAAFTARFGSGTTGSFEVSRLAAGHKNDLRIELNGSAGSVAFSLERLNELELYLAEDDPAMAGFRRVMVTEPEHPWMSAWWPPGHVLGWEHAMVHQVRDLLDDIASQRRPRPSFADGLQVDRVLAAVQRSAASGSSAQVPARSSQESAGGASK